LVGTTNAEHGQKDRLQDIALGQRNELVEHVAHAVIDQVVRDSATPGGNETVPFSFFSSVV
jgi:hypothetical protein